MPFQRISILGVGLLGGSIGLAAKSSLNGCLITGYGHRPTTLRLALEVGAIDRACSDLAQAVQDADLVILGTPVGIFGDLLRGIRGCLPAGAVITDVGSTKRSVVNMAQRLLPRSVAFVGSHPMAGSEKRGVEFARTDLFHNALCITTPTRRTDPAALKKVEEFWRTIGMRIVRLSPAEHDRVLADVSHLPHALAAALVAMQSEQALGLAGKGFLDTTRIAGGDGALWRDILLDNRANLRSSLRRLRRQIDRLEEMLRRGDGAAIARWLDGAAARRQALLNQKLSEINPD